MKKQYRRYLASKILHAAVRSVEYGCFLMKAGGVEDSVRDRERWKGTFTEKEMRLLDQRRKRLWDLAQEIKKLAWHLDKD